VEGGGGSSRSDFTAGLPRSAIECKLKSTGYEFYYSSGHSALMRKKENEKKTRKRKKIKRHPAINNINSSRESALPFRALLFFLLLNLFDRRSVQTK
jgi:hypothetical protein